MMFSTSNTVSITVNRTILFCFVFLVFWGAFFWCWMSLTCFLTNIHINVYFYHGVHWPYWHVYVPDYPIWTTDFFFLASWNSVILVLQWLTSQDVSNPDLVLEYWTEHITIGLFCVKFIFSTRIFNRRVPGIATDCAYKVWCHGLTYPCMLVRFWKYVLNDSWFVILR